MRFDSDNGRSIMKAKLLMFLAALIAITSLAGCSTVREETAMQWMEKQPNNLDP